MTLVGLPNFPYYPQLITIEVYSPQSGSKYIARKKVLIKDCDGDDPTCREYYSLDPFQVYDEESVNISDSNEPILHPENKSKAEDSEVKTKNSIGCNRVEVFDIIGRSLYQGKDLDLFSKTNYQGLIIIVYYNESDQIIEVIKNYLMN